ncbi:MAG: hypothetical protein CUN53_00125 [Phototrophicales bacterium]|nr:MAG: hypothetical protein CUN53_00125 [Phototrophicales bacterium]
MPLAAARVLPATSMDFPDGSQRFNWCRCNSASAAAAPGLAGLGAAAGGCQCDSFWTNLNGGVCSDGNGSYLRPDCSSVDSSEVIRVFSGGGGSTPAPAAGAASSIVSTARNAWGEVKQNESLVYGLLGLAVAVVLIRR